MLTLTTPLGRPVSMDDWIGLHRDSVLKFLFDVSKLGGRPSASFDVLGRTTALDQADLTQVIQLLVTAGFVEQTGDTATLTELGLDYVAQRVQ